MPNNQEWDQVARRVPNSHEGTDSGRGAVSGKECVRRTDKRFALDSQHSYFCYLMLLRPFCDILNNFEPFNAFLGHFMAILPPGMAKNYPSKKTALIQTLRIHHSWGILLSAFALSAGCFPNSCSFLAFASLCSFGEMFPIPLQYPEFHHCSNHPWQIPEECHQNPFALHISALQHGRTGGGGGTGPFLTNQVHS